MKKTILILSLVVVGFSACIKNDLKQTCDPVNGTAPTDEVFRVKQYIDSVGITATQDPRGFFYRIDATGTAERPTVCNQILINYSGSLTSGAVFDARNDIQFRLSDLILGWQEGIPLIGAGGSITLYLPPSLGYGAVANGNIPANSILIFKVDLKSFN